MRRGLFFVKIKLFLGFANFLYVKTFLTARAMFSFFWKTSFTIIAPENLDKLDSPLGKSRGGNALSLPEVKEPEGSLCIFAYFLYIRK